MINNILFASLVVLFFFFFTNVYNKIDNVLCVVDTFCAKQYLLHARRLHKAQLPHLFVTD